MQQEFVLTGSVEQFQGAVHRASEVFPVAGERLRPLCKSDLPRLIELASRGSGFDRDGLLPLLLDSSSGIGLERNGALMGFALFRRFGRGYAIGPVITPVVRSVDNGECLVRYLLRRFEGVLLRIDLPSGSALGAQLLKLGLQHVDTVHTMVKNRAPRSDGHFQQVALISHSLC
ncbi:hypothetical protein [Caballeronia hypogeia]|nr:hypothetical protein [Caballeronia hypogeia]